MSDGAYDIILSDVLDALRAMPRKPLFKLVVSSPPYNMSREYEQRTPLEIYRDWQNEVIAEIVPRLQPDGALCWQVGSYVSKDGTLPLDYLFIPLLSEQGLALRNRYIWRFGHGLHAKHKLSGRHETVLWTSPRDMPVAYDSNYLLPYGAARPANFEDLPPVVAEQMLTDVWDIPNVKHNHPEKIEGEGSHPCQLPVAIAERLVLGLSKPGDLIFDPFAGLASVGVAALVHGRRFLGIERDAGYHATAMARLADAAAGRIKWRSHETPVIRPPEITNAEREALLSQAAPDQQEQHSEVAP